MMTMAKSMVKNMVMKKVIHKLKVERRLREEEFRKRSNMTLCEFIFFIN